MKKLVSLLLASSVLFAACNNEGKDSVEKADSANEAKIDSPANNTAVVADAETAAFLVDAANGGMTEVQLGQVAEQKGTDAGIKRFGAMLAADHSGANNQVKTLAAQRNVTLPATVSDEKQKDIDDFNKKAGTAFDKSYIRYMVKDHEDDIKAFENASEDVKDSEVKAFIDNTLPKLRMHLDSAKAIQKRLKY
ncbi:MAG: DUF4142 domain-containing protein [Chitinophagaceae bacterium]|nr:DUF4142 domain-containing protein [Chitinophagaceae bacterium]